MPSTEARPGRAGRLPVKPWAAIATRRASDAESVSTTRDGTCRPARGRASRIAGWRCSGAAKGHFPQVPRRDSVPGPRRPAGPEMTTADPRQRVRQLLLSGDNTLKNRTGPESLGRARRRYDEAREVAVQAGLEELLPIIERRIADLAEAGA